MNEHLDDRNALTPEVLTAYFDTGYPAERRPAKEPLCVLGIDPPRGELTLCTPVTGSDIDVSAYRMICTDIVEELGDETVRFRATVEAKGIEYEVYSLLQAVTDQLQQDDNLERAPHAALDAFRGLLARVPRLSKDQEIGLFDELVALDRLIDGVGEARVLAAWLGPRAEEHDFVLGEVDVEVKTTHSERRIHIIHGLGQLTLTSGWLLHPMSVQVTGVGAADNGEILPELIKCIHRWLWSERTDFDGRLTDCGWEDIQADRLYTARSLIRSEPRFHTVDETFPVITSAGLSRVVTCLELVHSIDYRVDVTGLKPEGAASAEFAAAPMHED